MWNFLTAIVNRFSERAFFGFLIVGAFVLVMGTLAHIPLPGETPGEKNAELFGQGFVALIGAIGIIVGAIWKNSPAETKNSETLRQIVEKQPPVTGEAKESQDEQSAANATPGITGPKCPACGYVASESGHVPHTGASIPDDIPGL